MRFHFVVFIAILALVKGQDHKCPDGWVQYQDGKSCVKAFADVAKTWDEARSECQTNDGDLVKTNNPVIRDLVTGLLSKGKRYWIGLRDEDKGGKFEWIDGQKQTSFQWWSRGQPNNRGGRQQCVEIIGSKQGRWNDRECSKKRHFVCETASKGMAISGTTYCDFENEDQPLCGLFDEKGVHNIWKRQKAGTAEIGPRVDHSNSTEGHYLIAMESTTLNLIPELKQERCVSFWVLQHHANSVLEYSTSYHSEQSKETHVKWEHVKSDVMAGAAYFYLEVSNDGYFAIDDVRVERNPCNSLDQSGN